MCIQKKSADEVYACELYKQKVAEDQGYTVLYVYDNFKTQNDIDIECENIVEKINNITCRKLI